MTSALLALLVLAAIALLAQLVPVRELVGNLLAEARDCGAPCVLIFLSAYVVATVTLIPASLLTLGAGFVYGPLWAAAMVLPASLVGATLAFLIAKKLGRERMRRLIDDSRRIQALDRVLSEDSFRVLLLLRLSPLIPFGILNYLLGFSGVTLRSYILASAIGMLPGIFMYCYLGAAAPSLAQLEGHSSPLWFWIGLAVTIVSMLWISRRAQLRLRSQGFATTNSQGEIC